MGKLTRPSETRLRQILQRQDPPGFGPHYIPSIKATREEAPSKSRPAWVWWETVERNLSTLSPAERAVLVICLYNPMVWEVHDQRMLPTYPRPHPLSGHPKAVGLNLPPMRGTVEVATRMGLFSFHPLIRLPTGDNPQEKETLAFPWIGDLLLFLEDGSGPYNRNLDIKNEASEFEQSDINGVQKGKRGIKLRQKTIARHAIEKQLYMDAGISTLMLSRTDYDVNVVANLTQVYLWNRRKNIFTKDQLDEITRIFNGSIITRERPIETAWAISARHGWRLYDIKIAFYQAIWHRKIRVDLFEPIEFDYPLRAERRDVLDIYSHWFKRYPV